MTTKFMGLPFIWLTEVSLYNDRNATSQPGEAPEVTAIKYKSDGTESFKRIWKYSYLVHRPNDSPDPKSQL